MVHVRSGELKRYPGAGSELRRSRVVEIQATRSEEGDQRALISLNELKAVVMFRERSKLLRIRCSPAFPSTARAVLSVAKRTSSSANRAESRGGTSTSAPVPPSTSTTGGIAEAIAGTPMDIASRRLLGIPSLWLGSTKMS